MKKLTLLLVLSSLSFLFGYEYPKAPAPAKGDIIEPLIFPNSKAANAVITPFIQNTPKIIVNGEDLILPTNFKGTQHPRVCWDIPAKLDLSSYDSFECDYYISGEKIAPRSHIYFHSGNGWYAIALTNSKSNEWNHLVIKRHDVYVEDTPNGWSHIDSMRLAIWRDKSQLNSFAVFTNFRMVRHQADIAVIRDDNKILKTIREDKTKHANFAQESIFFKNVVKNLDNSNIPYDFIAEPDLNRQTLFAHKLVILPYNREFTKEQFKLFNEYAKEGGKIITFYEAPQNIASILGLKNYNVNIKIPGKASGFKATQHALQGQPAFVQQASWCYKKVSNINPLNRVLATWQDSQGKDTQIPAIILNDNGAFISHVLLEDTDHQKSLLILSLVGHFIPELYPQIAKLQLNNPDLKGTDGITDFTVFEKKFKNNRKPTVKKAFQKTMENHRQAQLALDKKEWAESIRFSKLAQGNAFETWLCAQKPKANEVRGIWCHDAYGIYGKSWDESIRLIAKAGLNRIYPNMVWGFQAAYPSKVLDSMKGYGTPETDQMRQCLDACKKYGVECHVWKVDWFDIKPDTSVSNKYEKAGRLQIEYGETKVNGYKRMCASNPLNIQQEIDSMLELVQNYPDLDGIHFDNIRYSNQNACFCNGCKQRFEAFLKHPVDGWPASAYSGKYTQQWYEFRRGNINQVVSTVAREARKINPKIKISAAVFTNYLTAQDWEGQDWVRWLREGWVDFVCPMNYTPDNAKFENDCRKQITWAYKDKIYPGLSATWPSMVDSLTFITQMKITRELNCPGFTIYVLCEKILPLLEDMEKGFAKE